MSKFSTDTALRGRLLAEGIALEIGNAEVDSSGNKQHVNLTDRIVLTPAAARHLAISLEEALATGHFVQTPRKDSVPDRVTPRGRTPVHAQSSAAVEISTRLMNAVSGLDIPFQHERSLRLIQGRMDGNRYLLTCNLEDLGRAAYDRIMAVVDQLGFPLALRESVRERIDASACVHFGFEEQGGRTTCKLYLEQAHDFEGLTAGPADPVLLHLAWKWQPDNGSWVKTRYLWHPGLGREALTDRVDAIYAGIPDSFGLVFVRRALDVALEGTDATKLAYLAITEGDNPRDSFDLNFYESGLQIKALQRELFALREQLAIPPGRFQALYDQIRTRPLGHIAGGVHREGEEFITIYYGVAGYPRFSAKVGAGRRAAERSL